MGLKADIEQAQKEAQMNSDDGSRRIEELLEEAKISGDQEQINQILAMTGENQESIAEAGKRLELLQEELLELNTSLNQQWADQLAALNVSLSSIDDIPQVITQLSQKQVEIQTAMAALQTAQEQVTDGKTTLDDAYVTLNRMEIDGILEMSEASAQLAVGEARLEQGQEKLEESKQSALESADLNQILSVETLGQILTAQNFSMPAGYIDDGKDDQWLLKVGENYESADQIKSMVLCKIDDIGDIQLEDVADITVIDNAGDSYAKVNGSPGVILSVFKGSTAGTSDVSKACKNAISELEEIYPCASGKAKVDEEFAKRAHDATVMLQNKDRGYTAIWNHILKVSIEDLQKNYSKLDVHFDLWKKESDAQPYIPDMVQMLKDKGLAYISNGALVVDVAKPEDTKEVPPCIILKSDGASLYQTTDLATIVEREKLFKPNRIIYVVDKRQEMHFTQVFRVSRLAELVPEDTKLQFLGFGTMNGKDGKPFKTRQGGVMRLEHLIRDINDAVYDKIMASRDEDEETARENAKIIGLSAIKYGDLSNQAVSYTHLTLPTKA